MSDLADCIAGCIQQPVSVPVRELGATEAPADRTPHPVYPDRWADGTQRPGFPGPALVHGGRSELVKAGALPGAEVSVAARTEREQGVITDLGGDDMLSTIARDQAGRYAELSIVADHLWQNLSANGVLTGKGKQRAALKAYLQTLDRLSRLALLLGLKRQPKPATSPLDYIEGRADA